jgi:hypothetical protein
LPRSAEGNIRDDALRLIAQNHIELLEAVVHARHTKTKPARSEIARLNYSLDQDQNLPVARTVAP